MQGLRAVAVLLVFANHLLGWPRGGFIGVDVFFVISGFLITGNLLRMADANGNVPFRQFYWNRVRRIVPAATVVLAVTCVASLAIFQLSRAREVGTDALYALVFLSNWWFAVRGTNYFASGDAVSPLRHYWSLSIEEQFYFVWPALIFGIGVTVAAKGLTPGRRSQLAGRAMAAIAAASLIWAVYQSATAPTWAYFDTASRVWELGVGALLATATGALGALPTQLKAAISWAGIALIGISAFVLTEGTSGFPAPWAILPVVGSAMVIAAGVGGEPRHQPLLCNQLSVYLGNVSYSLYLVHWPVIVLLGALMTLGGGTYYFAVVSLSLALAIASYHFVENPLRYGSSMRARRAFRKLRRGQFQVRRSTQYAAAAAVVLLTASFAAFSLRPYPRVAEAMESATSSTVNSGKQQAAGSGPLASKLQQEILAALQVTEWPVLNPTIESVLGEGLVPPDMDSCGQPVAPVGQSCTWGSESASKHVVLVGDSIALNYAEPLRALAIESDGRIQLQLEAMAGCQFSDERIFNSDETKTDACPARKQHTVDIINAVKPDVVVIAGSYGEKRTVGNSHVLTPDEWGDAMRRIVDKFKRSTKKIVWLASPPADKNIADCYGVRSSVPGDCVSRVTSQWAAIAEAEQLVARSLKGAVWIDSRPLFCSADSWCPAFVGSTPTKRDSAHMTVAYGKKIKPVIGELFAAAHVF